MANIEAICFPMKRLEEIVFALELLAIFKKAERLILKCRELPAEQMHNKVKVVQKYVEKRYTQLLSKNIYEAEPLQRQYENGIFYIGHVALTGQIP